MTKAAFAQWNDRIAPVFDVARHVHLVEADSGRIASEAEESFSDDLPAHKAARLAELGVRTLVCGAVSRPAHELLRAHGIEVIPFVTGDLQDVIQAWLKGAVRGGAYAMPGCRGRRRRRRQGLAGEVGICVCPACGHRESHWRGLPCSQTLCPACGAAMVRGSAGQPRGRPGDRGRRARTR